MCSSSYQEQIFQTFKFNINVISDIYLKIPNLLRSWNQNETSLSYFPLKVTHFHILKFLPGTYISLYKLISSI